MRIFLAAAALLIGTAPAFADPGPLPDPKLTPGVARSDVTAADLCPHADTRALRHVTLSMHKAVFAAYHVPWARHAQFEDDHLISLELGGSNDNANRWPEPYARKWNARIKDKLENKLHALVCAGTIPLAQAQHEIASDWVSAYRKYLGDP